MKPEHTRPFNIEHAKAGAPIETRHGKKAYFVAHAPEAASHSRIIVRFASGEIGTRRESGKHYEGGEQVPGDLVMAPLGHIEGKPVFVGDKIEDGGPDGWTYGEAHPGNRNFTGCRWPAPAKVYPETSMRHEAMFEVYAGVGRSLGYKEIFAESSGLATVANAALRHAIDANQVVPISEAKPGIRPHNPYTGALRDPRDIESDPMGVLITCPGEPIRATERDAGRDMAVAQAVRHACVDAFDRHSIRAAEWSEVMGNLDLSAIINNI